MKRLKPPWDRLEIDELGLDANDRRMLETMIRYYKGGPVGLETLAAAIGEEAVTIEEFTSLISCRLDFSTVLPGAGARPTPRTSIWD